MREDECKQGEDRRRAGVGLALLRRMETGGMPDSTGTSHARIYHSAAVTAGQGTDVSVYLRATSDWPSLALAPTALPMRPLRLHEREKACVCMCVWRGGELGDIGFASRRFKCELISLHSAS